MSEWTKFDCYDSSTWPRNTGDVIVSWKSWEGEWKNAIASICYCGTKYASLLPVGVYGDDYRLDWDGHVETYWKPHDIQHP